MAVGSQLLRELFERSGVIRVVGAHNALGAKLAARAGFDAVWAGGLEISTAHGVPDANILTMSELLNAAASMVDASPLPVVADCDTGFGNSNNVIHLVRKYEAAGMAAVCIEDKLFPKVNSFVPGRQELATVAEFVGKLMAAKNAQRDPAFMVIARLEALIAGWGIEEALRRAHAYVEAGADAVLIHSKERAPGQIVEFARAWQGAAPVVVVPTTYYGITVAELEALGVKMVIYANHGLRASVAATLDAYRQILEAGTTAPVEDRLSPLDLIFELQGMPQMKRAEEAYLRTGPVRTRAVIAAAGDHMADPTMRPLLADTPIAMLDVNGKPLLRRQVETLNRAGVADVTVVAGYRGDQVSLDGVRVVQNPQWATTGEMRSIVAGAEGGRGRVLIAYADILFDGEALATLVRSEEEITLLVDYTYDPRSYRPARRITPAVVERPRQAGRRGLDLAAPNRVLRIGTSVPPAKAHCEYVGLALFSEKGSAALREAYEEALAQGGPFHDSPSADVASLTDTLQELIDRGVRVTCVGVASGWLEIRSFDDYRLASSLVAR